MARCICSRAGGGCGAVFANTESFDIHRTGEFGVKGERGRRCMTEDEMLVHGLVRHPSKRDPRGPVWISARALASRDSLKGIVAKRPRPQGQNSDPLTGDTETPHKGRRTGKRAKVGQAELLSA